MAVLNGIPPFTEQFLQSYHCAIWQSSITTYMLPSLITVLCTMASCNFNFYQWMLYLFHKHDVIVLELGFCTSRWCTMQLNHTQSEPLNALLQPNFCSPLKMALVPPDADFHVTAVLPLLLSNTCKSNPTQPWCFYFFICSYIMFVTFSLQSELITCSCSASKTCGVFSGNRSKKFVMQIRLI
jgi:hypothetical protein